MPDALASLPPSFRAVATIPRGVTFDTLVRAELTSPIDPLGTLTRLTDALRDRRMGNPNLPGYTVTTGGDR